MPRTIGNPISVVIGAIGRGARSVEEGVETIGSHDDLKPRVKQIAIADLKSALKQGFADFAALRTDVMFIVLAYPIIGLLIAGLAFNAALAPLLFPMAAGFAILGPVACTGLYEMSKRRESGEKVTWGTAFGVLGAQVLGPLLAMSAYLLALFIAWMFAANLIHEITMGGAMPAGLTAFVTEALTTQAGITMLVVGMAVGFVFALIGLVTTVVAAPMLVDRPVGLPVAVATSVRVAQANIVPILAWGALVAVLLAIGIATLFIGLIVVLPVLGHATWHLYRATVRFE